MRVLWAAFACAPGRGSEPGLADGLMRHLAPHLESLTVLTPSHNRPLIEAGPVLHANVAVEYVGAPALRGGAGHRVSYLLWLRRALRRARELHAARPFDLVHHVTYAMSWIPPLVGRLGVPFVWNAGNALRMPVSFLSPRHPRGALGEAVRNLAVGLGWPASRRLVRADVITLGHALGDGRVRPFFLPALDVSEVEGLARRGRPGRGFTVVSVGRPLFWKGLHLGLEAFAREAGDGWEYVVVGTGPEETGLGRLARRLGVADRVRFTGWLPRSEVLQLLSAGDVFLLPTLHDSGSWATLEAMAAGLPIVCLDRGGPGLLVDERVGVKVPAGSPGQVVDDLATALRSLAQDPTGRHRMGEEARRLVLEHHTWPVRAEEVLALYREVARNPRARAEGDRRDRFSG